MKKKKLEHYTKVLLDRRLELQAELKRINGEQKERDRPDTMDTVDQADSNYSMDYNITMREKVIGQIKEFDEALENIKSGDYGICQSCGDEIPEGRLEVRPNARFCTRCKDEMEKKGALK